MKKADTGKLGELETARFLRKKGYDIVCANFRSRYGEIDIVAKNDKNICFVEVKTRAPDQLFDPKDAVTVQKRKKIISTAKIFLAYNDIPLEPRFDIAEVIACDGKVKKINLIENAFDSEAR